MLHSETSHLGQREGELSSNGYQESSSKEGQKEVTMNRRSFLQRAMFGAAALAVDPERLLWTPGKKTIFIPPAAFDDWKWAPGPTLEEWVRNMQQFNPLIQEIVDVLARGPEMRFFSLEPATPAADQTAAPTDSASSPPKAR